jgi:hypothetical protein
MDKRRANETVLALVILAGIAVVVAVYLHRTTGPPRATLAFAGVKDIAGPDGALQAVTYFKVSNTSPQRWLYETTAIKYFSPTGEVSVHTSGFEPHGMTEYAFLSPGESREFFLPAVLTNGSIELRLTCHRAAGGLLRALAAARARNQDPRIKAMQNAMGNSESFEAKPYKLILRETQ